MDILLKYFDYQVFMVQLVHVQASQFWNAAPCVYTIGTLQAPLYYIHYDLLSLQDLPIHTALLIITHMHIMYVGS